jgi:hypothetical protein
MKKGGRRMITFSPSTNQVPQTGLEPARTSLLKRF